MSVNILPHLSDKGQAGFSTGNPPNADEITRLKRENESLQKKNAELQRYKQDVGRVLHKEWNANTKITYLELVTTALNTSTPVVTHNNKEAAQIETTARALSNRLHISNKTASNALHQLEDSGLLEWQQPDTVLCDKSGRVLDKYEARQVSSNEIGKGKAFHFQKGDGVLYVPKPPPVLPRIEQTAYDKAQRTKATNERARLKQALEIIEKASCPECGTEGELRAVCKGCGCQIDSLMFGEIHTDESTPAMCEFHTVTTDTNTPPELVKSTSAEKITRITTEAENFTHPARPAPHDDSPAARLEVWLNAAIGADARLAYQNPKKGAKYLTLPIGTVPDFTAMLGGSALHVYATRPRLDDGRSWVLFADNDKDSDRPGLSWEELKTAMGKLRRVGIFTIVFRREGDKARLWWLFTHPIVPGRARRLILSHAPELEALGEWFPANSGGGTFKDCRNKAVSLSIIRLRAGQVVGCPMFAETDCGAVRSAGWLHNNEAQETIAHAFERSVTRAELVESVPEDDSDYEPEASTSGGVGGGISVSRKIEPYQYTPISGDDEVKSAIAWKKSILTPAMLGLPDSGYFTVRQIREERTPSFHWDYDQYAEGEWICTDFGTNKKYDIFDLWVAIEQGSLSLTTKSKAVGKLMKEYRAVFAGGGAWTG